MRPVAPDNWPANHDKERSVQRIGRHIEAGGQDPSLLLYSICGTETRSSSSGKQTHQRACHIPPNTLEGVPIENDCFVGRVLCMHGPSPQDKRPRLGPYTDYFGGRKRNWEFRVQGRFKRVPRGDLYVGIILRDFNYHQAVASTSMMVKRAGMGLLKTFKYDIYLSWGDRCEASEQPDAELSHLVTNMSGWDQVIVTPEGTTPPPLNAELQDLGDVHGRNLDRAKMGLSRYSAEVQLALKNMRTTDTFTLCSWGVSQVVDPLRWQFKIGTYISLARFMEDMPLHIAMYELLPAEDGGQRQELHLESRKNYYLDFMFWSSLVEYSPSLASRYVFQDAPEELERFAAEQVANGALEDSDPDMPRMPFKRQDSYSKSPCMDGLRRLGSFLGGKLRRAPGGVPAR